MTKYIAIDPAGIVHKRTTKRTYTHTVVVRGGYQKALELAADKGWTGTDASNFHYHRKIATGERIPHKAYRAQFPARWSAEQLAEEAAWVEAANAEAVAKSAAEIEGHDEASYIAAKRAERLANVEQRLAIGDFVAWVNIGWCGRRDLAEKLAASARAKGDFEAVILPAEEA